MNSVDIIYKGWILGDSKDEFLLKSLEIKIGKIVLGNLGFTAEFENCIVPNESLKKLDKYWGRLIWGLKGEIDDQDTRG